VELVAVEQRWWRLMKARAFCYLDRVTTGIGGAGKARPAPGPVETRG
jgi:hypothetical protein